MSTETGTVTSQEGPAVTIAPPVNMVSPYLLLAVEDIRLPEITNVRPFSSRQDGEKEIADIQRLALSIEQEGQLEPVIVMARKDVKEGEPPYDLIAGRRRLKAITMHNLSSDKPLKVKAVITDPIKAVSQMFRRAAHENLLREDITAIDFAHNIREVRKNMKWGQAKDTKKVAEFFGCSEAQVTQHEKLLGLDEEFQQAIADGKLSREGAYALLKVKEDKRHETYESAAKKQKTELDQYAIMTALPWAQEPGVEPKKAGTHKAKKSGAAKSGGVKAKHIKQAARQVDPEARQARSKKDIIDFFVGCQGPVYGYEDGAVNQFCVKFFSWVKGEIQDRTLEKYFDLMVRGADKGTAPKKEPKEIVTESKAADAPKSKK